MPARRQRSNRKPKQKVGKKKSGGRVGNAGTKVTAGKRPAPFARRY